MTLTRLTPLNSEAILPLKDAKLHLKVDANDDDSLIRTLRDEALAHVEEMSGWALDAGSFRWTSRRFVDRIELPIRPITEITLASYLDASGVAQVYDGAQVVDGAVWPAEGTTWPYASGHASIEFTAGPPPAEKLAALLVAALIRLEVLYDRGGAPVEVMRAREKVVQSIIDRNRAWLV